MPEKIYGHSMAGMILNLILPLVALTALITLSLASRIRNKKVRIAVEALSFGIFLLFLPNATYLSLELRHLQVGDRVLEDFNVMGILFFSGIVVLGWFEQVFLILAVVQWWRPLRKLQIVWMGVLSFLTTWGSVIGVERVNSVDVFYKPFAVIDVAVRVLFSNWTPHIIVYSMVLFITLVLLWSIPHVGNKLVRKS